MELDAEGAEAGGDADDGEAGDGQAGEHAGTFFLGDGGLDHEQGDGGDVEEEEEFDAEEHVVFLRHGAFVVEVVGAGEEEGGNEAPDGGAEAVGRVGGEHFVLGEVAGVDEAAYEEDGGGDVEDAGEVGEEFRHWLF